jgi:hypothetical protein
MFFVKHFRSKRVCIAFFAVFPPVFPVDRSTGLVQYLGGGVEGTEGRKRDRQP